MLPGPPQGSPPSALREVEWPKVSRRPWVFRRFPIVGWWGPPGNARLDDFIRYREAGFSLYPLNCDTNFFAALELSRKADLPALAFCTHQDFQSVPASIDWGEAREWSDICGWITHDIPDGHAAIHEAISAMNAWMRWDSARWAFFNFLPVQKQRHPSTTEIIDAAARAGMPILSYYDYVMTDDGQTRTTGHFKTIEVFRQASVRHGIPFWAFALTVRHWHYRRPSESDLRWKQFTNLAFGAKGLWYFTYWAPNGWKDWDEVAIVDGRDGQPTELYEWVRAINHAVSAAGSTLLDLKSIAVVHNSGRYGLAQLSPGEYWIEAAVAEDLLIGFFEDSARRPYAWVVNNRHGMGYRAADLVSEVHLAFARGISAVEAICRLDGPPGPLPIRNRTLAFSLPGGTGILLRGSVAAEQMKTSTVGPGSE